MRAAIYARVSVVDKQTNENQINKLTEAAKARGWDIVHTYTDTVSGAKDRHDRPGLDAALKGASKHSYDVLMVWSIDRLGRSLRSLLDTLQELEHCRRQLYIDQQCIDTTTPAGRLVFAVIGAIGEFERSMIRARVHAGLARARSNGVTLGRPRISDAVISAIRSSDLSERATAKKLGVSAAVVHKYRKARVAHV